MKAKTNNPNKPIRQKDSVVKTQAMTIAPVKVEDAEAETVLIAVKSLGFNEPNIEALAKGAFKMIGTENGELTERGINRVRGAVKFLSGLMSGKKHKVALEEAGLAWAQVSAFCFACPEFRQIYSEAKKSLKLSMGMSILDTAFEMATEGSEVYYKGEVIGKKKSEKMLDRLMVLAGKEFTKDYGKGAAADTGKGGGIILNFHFDGKKNGVAVDQVETVDV